MFKKHPVLTVISLLLVLLLTAMFVTGVMIMTFGSAQPAILPQYLLVLGTTVEGTEPSPMLRDRITSADRRMEQRTSRPFSRQELAVLFAAMLMEG